MTDFKERDSKQISVNEGGTEAPAENSGTGTPLEGEGMDAEAGNERAVSSAERQDREARAGSESAGTSAEHEVMAGPAETNQAEGAAESPSRAGVSLGALLTTLALLMFVGGALVTLMLVARSFELHGTALVAFVVASCALVLGLAGGLLLRILGDRWWIGAVIGACFGAFSALLIYAQTQHHTWWR